LRKRIFLLFLFIIGQFFCSGIKKPTHWNDIEALVPNEYKNRVCQALTYAGDNEEELVKVLLDIPADHRASASFLIANMPRVDLAAIKSSVLIENIELAYKSRDIYQWAKNVPDDLFLYYVLPYRVSQEPVSDWRRIFFDSLHERLNPQKGGVDTLSMAEAELEVNRWCGERVKFKPTQRRDQGPLETLKSGYGRCEEMMIVHLSACRAVGIPARQVWTPYWATGDNNHAWSEVWVDGRWYYQGACEPAPKLCQAWFDKPVKRAALVFASVYGVPKGEESIYRKGNNYAIINITSNYSQTGILKVLITKKGHPVKNIPVTVSVFNFGSLRPIARLNTDASGSAGITIGEGSYFISGGTQTAHTWVVEYVTAGETKEVALNLDKPRELNAEFWLRYKPPEE
jgi:hypothetical protein